LAESGAAKTAAKLQYRRSAKMRWLAAFRRGVVEMAALGVIIQRLLVA
jgi:hypothetical protein